MKIKSPFIKNRLISIIAVVCFFGMYPREAQHSAPTVFAMFAVIVYGFNVFILDIAMLYKNLKEEENGKNKD